MDIAKRKQILETPVRIISPYQYRGLVAHWSFNSVDIVWGDTGSEIKDRSGNGHHGAAYGGFDVTDIETGLVGDGAASLKGDPLRMVDFGIPTWLGGLTQLTVSQWHRNFASSGTLNLMRAYSATDRSILATLFNDLVSFKVAGPSGELAGRVESAGSEYPNDNSWRLVTCVWYGDNATKIFIDGLENTDTVANDTGNVPYLDTNTTEHLLINARWNGGVIDLVRDVVQDDIMIYNRALSDQEILNYYNRTKP